MYLCFSITHTQETGRKYINNLSMLGGGITDDFFSKFATFNFFFISKTTQWKKSESESRSVVSDSLQPQNYPGQSTGVGSLSLLQGSFPTQVSNPGLPHYRWILYQLSHNTTHK